MAVLKEAGVTLIGDRVRIVIAIRAGFSRVFATPELPVHPPVPLGHNPEPAAEAVGEGLPNGRLASSPPRFRLRDRFSDSATLSPAAPPLRSEKVSRRQQAMEDVTKMLADHFSKAELDKSKRQPQGAEQKERPRTQAPETHLFHPALGVCEIVRWPQLDGQLSTLSLDSQVPHAAHMTEPFYRSSLPQGYKPPPSTDVPHASHRRRRNSSPGHSARY